jgi:carbamoyltransferase
MNGCYLCPSFHQAAIERRLRVAKASFQVLKEQNLLDACVDALVDGKAVGWFQGRMEFGPRALGARSWLIRVQRPCSRC